MRVLRGIKPESKSISSADNTEPSCGRVAPHCQRTSLGYRLGRYRSSRHRISPGTAPAQRSPRVPAPYTRREKPPTSATDAPPCPPVPTSPCPPVPVSNQPRPPVGSGELRSEPPESRGWLSGSWLRRVPPPAPRGSAPRADCFLISPYTLPEGNTDTVGRAELLWSFCTDLS